VVGYVPQAGKIARGATGDSSGVVEGLSLSLAVIGGWFSALQAGSGPGFRLVFYCWRCVTILKGCERIVGVDAPARQQGRAAG